MKEFLTYHEYHSDDKIKLWISDDIKQDKHPSYDYCILSKYNFPYKIELTDYKIYRNIFNVYNHFQDESPYASPITPILRYINKDNKIVELIEKTINTKEQLLSKNIYAYFSYNLGDFIRNSDDTILMTNYEEISDIDNIHRHNGDKTILLEISNIPSIDNNKVFHVINDTIFYSSLSSYELKHLCKFLTDSEIITLITDQSCWFENNSNNHIISFKIRLTIEVPQ